MYYGRRRLGTLLSFSLACWALLSASCSSSGPDSGTDAEPASLTVAVIPMGTTHEHWKSIHAGAEKAAQELGVEVLWKGPQKEDDREQQIAVVEDMISRGVDGIVLAPLDRTGLRQVVAEAKRAGISTVTVDSGLEGDEGSVSSRPTTIRAASMAPRAWSRFSAGRARS